MNVKFAPSFVRAYKRLPIKLQEEIKERIALFECDPKHPYLKTHTLKGALEGRGSFSVNYKYRIVFMHQSRETAVLLIVGDHDAYR